MKLLLVLMLGLSATISLGASWENEHLVTVTGEGSNCEEAGQDLILQLDEMGLVIDDIDISACQSPHTFAKPQISADVHMRSPHLW